jgi:hypothetical protein
MLKAAEIKKLGDSPLFQKSYEEGDNPLASYALPDSSVDFLIALARQLEVANVFEFGSGSSTLALLKSGYSVTSLEDSPYWMEQTLKQLPEADKSRHTALVRPLSLRWHGLIPMMDWAIDAELAARLRAADLILVDSPSYLPFRESTLWSALTSSPSSVVVLDDTRIHTLSRFCDQIAAANPRLWHRRVRIGHCFDIFARLDDSPLRISHTPLETLKGWRRLFQGRQVHAKAASSSAA